MKVEVRSPWDGTVLETLHMGGIAHVEELLHKATGALRSCKAWIPVWERREILLKTAADVKARHEEFALLIAREGGKPLMDARVEVTRAIGGIELAAEEMGRMSGREVPMGLTPASTGRLAVTIREPIGVVVAVSAFNHPLNLIVHQVMPAVATGCPVIVKPATRTPLSCLALVECLHRNGLPEAWCQVALLGRSEAEALVTDSRVDYFSFIGSATVGWGLRSKLAPGTRCGLEHGGAAPVVVGDRVDLDLLVPPLMKGGFYHAGQVCVSVQRVFAMKGIAGELAAKMAQAASTLIVGDPTDSSTDVGPLIHSGEADRVDEWVKDAVKDGGQVLCGGVKVAESAYAPTIVMAPPKTARVSTEEIFGPVICVYPCEDVNDAVRRANSVKMAFQASVFTQDIDTAMHVARHLDASAVMINDHTAFRVDWMPFGGRRESGLGVGGIGYTMREMTQEKLIVLHHR
ncbi:aldehyde dehydrogenase family protein [Desulfoluna butyratoxydans]|uniref:Aldehyde/histidinol dehydrogenase n=1 Tax=Desulfoluna butyratoxydans TaxID=231438 RepID=A0A4U8YT13_9BACT|nr:aldehyde dehydrogenase family protein [Desulfoluna butyratoxydans]VFQ47061.1 aldehyde/histidinol dehydrogenase [Desulfoluna butyratoxydans]